MDNGQLFWKNMNTMIRFLPYNFDNQDDLRWLHQTFKPSKSMLFVNSELFYIHVCEKVDVHISLLNFHPFNSLHWCKKKQQPKSGMFVLSSNLPHTKIKA
jgi:hypothetical protein